MKKILILIEILLLSFVLAGCASKPSPKNPVVISIWHYYNGTQLLAFDEMVSEFNDTAGAEMGIFVESSSKGGVNELTQSINDSVQKKVGAEELPNIFACYADNAFSYDQQNVLASFDPYFTKKEFSEYVDSYLEEGRLDGGKEVKIIPTAKSTEIMLLNKTDWDRFSAATGASLEELSTWEGLARVAETYYNWTDEQTPEPNDGKAFFGIDSNANYLLVGLHQLGADPVKDATGATSLTLEQPIMERLWNCMYIPYAKGYYTNAGRFRSDDAKTGTVIAYTGSSSGGSYFPKEVYSPSGGYPIGLLALPMPNFEGTAPCAVQQGAGMVMTKSDSLHEYACAEFLKWFTQSQRNLEFCVNAGYLPVKKDVCTLESIEQFSETELLQNKAVQQSLEVAMKQFSTYEFYSVEPFAHSAQMRQVFEKSLGDAVNNIQIQRNTTTDKISSITEKLTSKEAFEAWYVDLNQQLSALFHS